ncbi:unnamed protein product [Leptosia nina]|uniref:Major facilitator superfamily (MFS) profile domain-containing protein n=1 Tax=Leptosia nina TaxID=320188 RepID=A0AAV1JKI4_9NEOP
MIFACIAMVATNWKTIVYIVYAPTILFLLYIPFIRESLRWLIVNDKIDEAKIVLRNIIKRNGIDVDVKEVDKMDLEKMKDACDVETYEQKEGYREAFRSREIIKRLVIATFCRFTACFTYYGLTFNSVMLPGNKYTNFLLTSLMSFPGDFACMFLMNKFGRKPPLICGYVLVAASCLLLSVVPERMYWLQMTMYLTSKLVIAACFTGIVTYIMELFPTSVRGTLLGVCVLTASLGTTLAPLTPALTSISPIITPACFGLSALISSVLLVFTPETCELQLVDTIEQLEKDCAMTKLRKEAVPYRPIINPVGFHAACRGHATRALRQFATMQLPETPPPPLAPLWDRVLRARALPPDLDVQLLYVAIKDRLAHPEWEVRLHALRVLADLLPLSGNALSFPFDQVIDNLGHSSPNVRKAALDALKVFCIHCEEPECAARAILDKCSYNNVRPHSADISLKISVVQGLVLSIPTLFGILKRRSGDLDMFPLIENLGEKLFDSMHKDAALRTLMKLRRVCGPRDYAFYFSRLDPRIQNKFRYLCEIYDEDSMDVYYAPRKPQIQHLTQMNRPLQNSTTVPLHFSTDSSTEGSYRIPLHHNNNFAKVIIETEIQFDSDTAITMTVLEQNETESDRNPVSDEDVYSDDNLFLKYNQVDSEEDSDVVVKRVRFGGESVKIRTPDSDNLLNSEEDINVNVPTNTLIETKSDEVLASKPKDVSEQKEIKRESFSNTTRITPKKSGIPLPVIQTKKNSQTNGINKGDVKLKSKSLSELYEYFNNRKREPKDRTGFALTLSNQRSPERVSGSPVEPHREVEVLHNLQRSPTISPRRPHNRVSVDGNGFVLNLIASSPPESLLLSPRPASPLRTKYDWESLDLVSQHVIDQLHNTENWIATVKAADQLHGTLLQTDNVTRVEPVALSLIQHMWALSDAVPATRAPAEGVVCAIVRNSSSDCIRQLLPALLERTAREPAPAALPHALLQRIALHHLIELIFDPNMIKETDQERAEDARLRATMCLARAAGPAAVLTAVRRQMAGSPEADIFCNKLRERLNKPLENIRPTHFSRISQLPVPRRRARSTPAAPTPRPRRLRPLPDSAPLPGIISPRRTYYAEPYAVTVLSEKHSSAITSSPEKRTTSPVKEEKTVDAPTSEIIESESLSNAPSTPSIRVQDYSESQSIKDLDHNITSEQPNNTETLDDTGTFERSDAISQRSELDERTEISVSRPQSEKSILDRPKSYSLESIKRSVEEESKKVIYERDVRVALAETIIPARHEDWEAIVNGLSEMERLAADESARAPAASWRAVVRAASTHVRSLRSKVARAACSALGTLFECRGKILEPEVEEATGALLERCADANRFLRAEAANALGRVACGAGCARSGVALARKGATHRAGPVRAAAAQALARLSRHAGPSRILELPPEPRVVILRAAGELLGDAHPETRLHARHLFVSLSEDQRFYQMLKDSMTPSRYRAIEKFVEKLRCR